MKKIKDMIIISLIVLATGLPNVIDYMVVKYPIIIKLLNMGLLVGLGLMFIFLSMMLKEVIKRF